MKCCIKFAHEFSLSHSLESGSVFFLGTFKEHDSDPSDNDETDSDDSTDNPADYKKTDVESWEDGQEVETRGHTATPHLAKKESPTNAKKSPKSGGQSSGGNKKQFNSGGKQFGSSDNKGKGKGRA